MKKIYLFLSLTALLASCKTSDTASSASAQNVKVTKQVASSVYVGNLDEKIKLNLPTTFFEVDEEVPYVSLKDFYSFYTLLVESPIPVYTVNGASAISTITGAGMNVDASSNTIVIKGLEDFLAISSIPNCFDPFSAKDDQIGRYNKAASNYVKGADTVINLNNYGLQVVEYSNQVYLPFGVIENIQMSRLGARFAFNGDNYYLVEASLIYDSSSAEPNALTQYGKAYFSGSYSNLSQRSRSYSDYFYNTFRMEMDVFYGRQKDIKVDDLDAKANELGLKDSLKSTDTALADDALAQILGKVYGDGGHTVYSHRGMNLPYSQQDDKALVSYIASDSRYIGLLKIYTSLTAARGALKNNLEVSGSTAIIRFDSFALNKDQTSPSSSTVEADLTSTFSILYHAFKTIKKDYSSVKNVVLDVSLNVGGSVMAMGQALSFLTDDTIVIHTKDMINGAYGAEGMDYDTNLDGNYSDNDSYAGKYNFFILTSGMSFSCANAFPCIAKEKGYAKIIGQTSGGGDCAVAKGLAIDGSSWQMSSRMKLTYSDYSSVDSGASPDYVIDYSDFYDAAKIDTIVNSIK